MNLARTGYDILKAVEIFIGKTHMPLTHKLIKAAQYRELVTKLKPGVTLLTRTRGETSNLFIPSFFTHGAIYAGNETIIEAVAPVVKKTDLIDFMMTKDYLAIVTPKGFSDIELSVAAIHVKSNLDCPYDFSFEPNVVGERSQGQFYCFELCAMAYKSVKTFNFEPRDRLGKMTYVGDDFIKARSLWQVDWYSPESSNKI